MKTNAKSIAGVTLALALLLSACGNGGQSSTASSEGGNSQSTSSSVSSASELTDEERWHGAYDEPVTIKVAIPTNAALTFPDGSSWSDNVWTRSLLEDLNIQVEVMWEAENASGQYDTKMNLAISSNDLPDIISLSNYGQFDKLYDAGKLEELTQYYEDYAYPYFKANIETDPQVLEWGTIEGKLMGIPQEGVNYQQVRMIWIREDWLTESGLDEPETIEDVIGIAKAFKDADPENRLGLAMFKTVLGDGMCDITGISNAMGAYPRVWLEDGNGGLKYGTIQPEFKEALAVYAELYADGYIDQAFASLDGNAVAEQLTSNKLGVIIGNSWLAGWPLNTLYDTDQVNWNLYPVLPSEKSEGTVKVQTLDPSGKMIAVRKGFEHPDALFKWLNYNIAKTTDPETAEPRKFHSTATDAEEQFDFAMENPLYVYWNDPMLNFDTQPHVTDAIDKKDKSYLTTVHDETQYASTIRYFDKIEAGEQITGSDWAAWRSWYGEDSAFGIMNGYFANDNYLVSKLAGYQTDTMVKQWGNLKTLEEQYIVEIISGVRPVDDFEEFVSTWKSMGGEQITQEVNEWYQSKQ